MDLACPRHKDLPATWWAWTIEGLQIQWLDLKLQAYDPSLNAALDSTQRPHVVPALWAALDATTDLELQEQLLRYT